MGTIEIQTEGPTESLQPIAVQPVACAVAKLQRKAQAKSAVAASFHTLRCCSLARTEQEILTLSRQIQSKAISILPTNTSPSTPISFPFPLPSRDLFLLLYIARSNPSLDLSLSPLTWNITSHLERQNIALSSTDSCDDFLSIDDPWPTHQLSTTRSCVDLQLLLRLLSQQRLVSPLSSLLRRFTGSTALLNRTRPTRPPVVRHRRYQHRQFAAVKQSSSPTHPLALKLEACTTQSSTSLAHGVICISLRSDKVDTTCFVFILLHPRSNGVALSSDSLWSPAKRT